MTQSAAQADAFYKEVVDGGEVWSIRDALGIPAPKNQDGQRSMPFWSKQSRVELVSKLPVYNGFEITPIPLIEWRERWLPGLEKDGILVGLNWSGARATGYDIQPDVVEKNLTARDQAQPAEQLLRSTGGCDDATGTFPPPRTTT